MTPSSIAARPAILDDKVLREIHPDDGMLPKKGPGHVEHYFACGRDAIAKICGILATSQIAAPTSVLDFACGYGRVARYIRAAFPEARLFAADVNRNGVNHCALSFGADPIFSTPSLDALSLPKAVSLIWCGSLMTHLAEDGARKLLQFFHRSLEPGGVAVFTCHGRYTASFWNRGKWPYNIGEEQMKALHDAYGRHEYGCAEQGRIQGYGISITPVTWIMDQLPLFPGTRLISLIEQGWDDHQDIVAIRKALPRR